MAKARNPSAANTKAYFKKKAVKRGLKDRANAVEEKARKSGGYGKAVVSIWEAPKGGLEKSPAYRKLLTRSWFVL